MELGLIPDDYDLLQNFPNPFSGNGAFGSASGTTIRYQLPAASCVRLGIYDILGRRVRTLVQRQEGAGYHRVVWDGRNAAGAPVSSGVYFYVLQTEGFVKRLRMMIVK